MTKQIKILVGSLLASVAAIALVSGVAIAEGGKCCDEGGKCCETGAACCKDMKKMTMPGATTK
jgi:hypothetical protein